VLATLFFLTSLALTYLASQRLDQGSGSVMEAAPIEALPQPSAPVPGSQAPAVPQ
jgi:preprotein translocase subunit SecG